MNVSTMEINSIGLQVDGAGLSGVVFIDGRYYEVQGCLAFEPVATGAVIVYDNPDTSADEWIGAHVDLNHEEFQQLKQPNAMEMFHFITTCLNQAKPVNFGDTFATWETSRVDSYESGSEGELNEQTYTDEKTFTEVWHLIARSVKNLQASH